MRSYWLSFAGSNEGAGLRGRGRVDHRPGSHDDRANVVAGVVYLAGSRSSYDIDALIRRREADGQRRLTDFAIEPCATIRATMVRVAFLWDNALR